MVAYPTRKLNTRLVKVGLQIQIEVVVIFLMIFGSHMNIFIHYPNEDSCVC